MQLQRESRFLLHWPVVLMTLSVLLISICAKSNDDLAQSNDEATINNVSTDDTQEQDFGSRSALGGRYMDKLPDWLFPIICLKQLNKMDGKHCGMAIRLDRDIFLASVHSIVASIKGHKPVGPKPQNFYRPYGTYFGFNIQTIMRIDEPYPANDEKYCYWKPEHKVTYKYGIAMYKVVNRGIGEPGPKEQIPVLPQKPLLDDREPSNKTLCRVYTFGDQENSGKGVNRPWRRPVALYVQEMACGEGDDDVLCQFGPAFEPDNENDTGFLCSNFADLGAPVVCGLGRGARIRYIITGTASNNTRDCNRLFSALKLKRFTKQILEDVDQYTEETNI